MSKTKSGFTLVELLIVIVIIAILAAITIVAYNGITNRANDSAEKSAVNQFQQLLEMYNADNSQYPKFCSTDNTGCDITTPISTETSLLTPIYTASVPSFPETTQYVRQTNGTGYGLLISYRSGTCRTGVNVSTGWWSSSPAC